MNADYRFDAPALNIAQKIMECRATAAADGWPDVRLKAAIQCLVIEAMKWAAPAEAERRTGFPGVYEVFEAIPDQLRSHYHLTPNAVDAVLLAVQGVQSRPAPTVPEGWKLVPVEITDDMAFAAAPYGDVKDYYRALLSAAPAPGGGHVRLHD